MSYVPLEKLVKAKSNTSLYKLVLLSAHRANELAGGAPPLVKCESRKASTIALQEIAEEKVKYEILSKSKKSL